MVILMGYGRNKDLIPICKYRYIDIGQGGHESVLRTISTFTRGESECGVWRQVVIKKRCKSVSGENITSLQLAPTSTTNTSLTPLDCS